MDDTNLHFTTRMRLPLNGKQLLGQAFFRSLRSVFIDYDQCHILTYQLATHSNVDGSFLTIASEDPKKSQISYPLSLDG